MENSRDKYLEIIKSAYLTDFNRTLTAEETNFIFDTVSKHMRSELSKLPDFSEDTFNKYLDSNGITLTYSPAAICSEINRIIETVGQDVFSASRSYKRTREMEIAARVCLMLKKRYGEHWMIKIQDNPDIVVFKVAERSIKSDFMDAIQIEIMSIPEIAKKQLDTNNLVTSLLKFIREKKFKKSYGRCSLVVNLDFTHQNLDLEQASKLLALYKGNNPYDRIVITAIISQDLTTVTVMQIYPNFLRTDFQLAEQGLLY